MTFKMTDDVYQEAEKQYYSYINNLNHDNPSYTKPTLEEFRANLKIQNPDKLVHFHNWLNEYKAKEIQKELSQ